MPPRTKSHRLSAGSRNHSTTSLHKGEARLGGLTTIHKDDRKANPRDALHKAKKHSSSSSALAAKRTASKTSVHRASTTRLHSNEKQHTKQEKPADKAQDEEGWVSSESGAGSPNPDDDDEDDELDDEEILILQTQRAQRNAREMERLKAAMAAADAELRAKQQEDEASRTPPARESPQKHSNFSPARSSPLAKQLSPAQIKHASPEARQPQSSPLAPRQSRPPTSAVPTTLAPVIQQPVADHTKHTFPTQTSPSPPAYVDSHRSGPRHSDPIPHDFAQSNGTHHTTRNDVDHKRTDGDNVSARSGDASTRPSVRRSQSHMPRPAIITSGHVPGPSRMHSLVVPARPHPLIRAPSILTKTTPVLAPLTAPPYLSAHSAQAQMSSSPPPQTPSTTSAKSSPPHTRQPSLSSSTHTLPTLTVSPTAALTTSVSSLPHSPQTRALSIHSSPTTSYKPTPERERTMSAVSSTAALHALAHHHPASRKSAARNATTLQASTFPPEPADTYGGGMYGGGPGAGVYNSYGGYSSAASPGIHSVGAVVGASGGMYGGKPGPVHALLPAPYMATHSSVGRWYAPARDAIGRVVRGRAGA